METVVGIIPARHASSRFPGKPLVPLLGTPMIVHVARRTSEALGASNTFVATDDERIRRTVEAHGFQVVMTTSDARTGTDRIAQAVDAVGADIYINVQGDEPMLDPASIRAVVEAKRQAPELVINAMAPLVPGEDVTSPNIPKVVTNEANRLLYMSRSAVPSFKDPSQAPDRYWKQVCIYGFSRSELTSFAEYGRKSTLERSEDIEILRFFELGIGVQMVPVDGGSLAVDVPDDVPRVERAMRERGMR